MRALAWHDMDATHIVFHIHAPGFITTIFRGNKQTKSSSGIDVKVDTQGCVLDEDV